ncbi:hypothetical protein KVV02_006555 [Mortierella alpina]|uniref:Myb-like domain-containing protein n=1 Tax=Mortierella alpina TaxID=64518 RepID=A0A9P8A3P8_MORAP|nr:hypothetical protein KVV02_006555 [Mortierella alpina]
MDPHSIKRPRILPPEAKTLPRNTAPAALQGIPTFKCNTTSQHTSSLDSTHSHRPSVSMSTVGLGAPTSAFATPSRTMLTSRPSTQSTGGPARRRDSYSFHHSRDNLFHKDTHHRDLPKQQQMQLDAQKRYQQQLQLQEAHREFHRQRELYQLRQQQQPQQDHRQLQLQRLMHATSPSSSTTPSTSCSPSYSTLSSSQPQRPTATLPQHHHHHHHHHFHVHATPEASSAQRNQMNTFVNQRPSAMSSRTPSNAAVSISSTHLASASPSVPNPTLIASAGLHHHHHHHQHRGKFHQQLPQRSSQFSEWTSVKEKERARLLAHMARVREAQPLLPSAEAARENLKQLSQRIHQRRTRARETILYDLHQGVKTVEAQVQKQVDMVLSRLKDAPGSKYAFALTHTFLTQIPQALSNTILPSAISAVADTVAGRTTNSLTTLRGRAGLDEDDEEDDDDEDEDDLEHLDGLDEISYQQHMALMRLHHQQDSGWSQQLSSEFGTIALAPTSMASSFEIPPGHASSETTARSSTDMEHQECDATVSEPTSGCSSGSECEKPGSVSISSAGASEILAAYTHHNYSTAAAQVLTAALPSFIPSMVAPIVCVFSYPSPPATKPNSPDHPAPASPSVVKAQKGQGPAAMMLVDVKGDPDSTVNAMHPDWSQLSQDKNFHETIKSDPGIAEVTTTAWTTAEREALFLAATRFKLRGQWSKIRDMMRLHRTDKEIEDEYRRLYGEDSEDETDDEMKEDNDDNLVAIKKESDVEDGDADDEADAAVFLKFGGPGRSSPLAALTSAGLDVSRQAAPPQGSMLMDIQPLPTTATRSPSRETHRPYRRDPLVNCRLERSPRLEHSRPHEKPAMASNEKSLRVVKKEFLIDKRFTLEEIPMRL